MSQIKVGDTVTCAETGKSFTVESDGFTFNYARQASGEIISDEGVNIRERRGLLDRSKPFGCYMSGDGMHVTGWKGNILGTVTQYTAHRTGFYGSYQHYFSVTDVHGGLWAGRGAGPGMYCTLRAMKGK